MKSMDEFYAVIRALRAPDGCPWDRKQTHESLIPYALEETGEFCDEVEKNNPSGMCEELGDMLLQIMLHAVIAEEQNTFTFDDVVNGIKEKIIRRHPHVFGAEKVTQAEEVLGVWARMKAAEKGTDPNAFKSLLGHKPHHYPALRRAEEMTAKAAKVGFDWPDEASVCVKLDEEFGELKEAMNEANQAHIDEEIGDLLFVITNLIRKRGRASSENILHAASDKFERRFHYIEKALIAQGKTLEECTLAELDALWDEAKALERQQK